jgi:hypothetical protein
MCVHCVSVRLTQRTSCHPCTCLSLSMFLGVSSSMSVFPCVGSVWFTQGPAFETPNENKEYGCRHKFAPLPYYIDIRLSLYPFLFSLPPSPRLLLLPSFSVASTRPHTQA